MNNYGYQQSGYNNEGYSTDQGYSSQGHPHQGYGAPPPVYGGGFNVRGPQGPPPGADPQLWAWFRAVDKDQSNHISVHELQAALVNGDWTAFDLDTVKMLMNIFDVDRNGTIGFNEFSGVWKYIQDWQNVFRHFDKDRSGSIDSQELIQALGQFGYSLNPNLIPLIELKYGPVPAAHGQVQPGITFDRFVRACVAIKQLTAAFQRMDGNRTGHIQMNYEQFMQTVLSLP